ncbi:Uncharacterised protein [Chlamydia trachomatis]|nr:Uncharacterised protein [Chlamydia trachomatis]
MTFTSCGLLQSNVISSGVNFINPVSNLGLRTSKALVPSNNSKYGDLTTLLLVILSREANISFVISIKSSSVS